MTTLVRWKWFMAVGLVGSGVQFAALAALHHLLPGHDMAVSVAALEVTLLHNFAWHRRYTWADRTRQNEKWRALLRFHLANGSISLLGTVGLTAWLAGRPHLPLLLVNGLAMVGCALANFCAADQLAFRRHQTQKQTLPRVNLAVWLIAALLLPCLAQAQTGESGETSHAVAFAHTAPQTLPEAPQPRSARTHRAPMPRRTPANGSYFWNAGGVLRRRRQYVIACDRSNDRLWRGCDATAGSFVFRSGRADAAGESQHPERLP